VTRSEYSSGSGRPARVLVTGAAGFIGSHLCERLLDGGHRVWGIDNFDPYYPENLKRANIAPALENPSMRLIEADVRDGVLLDGLFRQVPFDAVVHLAARPGVRPSLEEPDVCLDINLNGTLRLLEAMRRHRVARLVFGSSSSVYGESPEAPFSEEQAADRPISPYAASKRSAELLVHAYHHLFALSTVCLRFFTVYGPRQRPDLAIHKFARLMRDRHPLPVFGDGNSGRDYTYVDDAVEAIERSLRLLDSSGEGARYEVLNVGRGEPVSLDQLLNSLAAALGTKPRLERLPDQPGDVPYTCASTERLERTLGFRPGTGLDEGLRRFVSWLEASPAVTV
jgi:UDP-glucuronate 4-epimerase